MSVPRVLFYVQHLLGIGHLRRAALLAQALADHGLETTLLTGGFPVPGLDVGRARLIQLAPVKSADSSFKTLIDERGEPIDDRWRDARRRRVLEIFDSVRPEVVMLEMYPFGRRQMRFELDALIAAVDAAGPRPLLLSSVRDVLVAKSNPARADEAVRLVERHFDAVLVHGDPAFIPFEASFPAALRIAAKLLYTGYVARPQPAQGASSDGEVIVSAGGGAVGARLIEAALASRALTPLAERTWRIIAGENLDDAAYARFRAVAPSGVVVERWRDDLPDRIARAALTISQAGYNTVMEIVSAGVPAVVVPFADAGETEQGFRARHFAERNLLTVVPDAELDGATLARGIAEALGQRRAATTPDMTGAATTARLVGELLARRQTRGAA
ncbi:MAG: glycosyl transferase [Alphaproteobacteria bacterium]|nr:glycosyl transferase [Alphaproteobacteria bacterium]